MKNKNKYFMLMWMKPHLKILQMVKQIYIIGDLTSLMYPQNILHARKSPTKSASISLIQIKCILLL